MINQLSTNPLPLVAGSLLGLFGLLALAPADLRAQSLRSDAANAVEFYNTDVVDEVYLDHQAANDGSAVSASGTHSFTGQDANGNTQTMVFTGQTTASATYGGLHSAASGTITNTYYNANNTPYIDPDTGNVNPNGSPEALGSEGYASFSETLQYGGALQAGYTARFIFHLDGTNGGGNLLAFLGADLQATVAGNPTEDFVAEQSGNVSMDFATKGYAINGNTPQSLMVVLQTEFDADLRSIPDGSNVSGFANFSDTLTLAGVEIVDANGNPVSGVTVTTNSGVPVDVVPEPSAWTLVVGATLLLLVAVYYRNRFRVRWLFFRLLTIPARSLPMLNSASRFPSVLLGAIVLATLAFHPPSSLRAQTVAAPTVIRMDFQSNTSFDGRAPVGFTGVESKAAAADPVFGSRGANTWNYLTVNPTATGGTQLTVNPSFSNLLDTTGAATTASLSFAGTIGGANDNPIDSNGSDAVDNDYFLINDAYASKTATYAISGLPANMRVALFLYAPSFANADSSNPQDNGNRSFTITANGVTINVNGGQYNDALAYVTTDANGAVSGTWSILGNEGDWSGLQIAYPVAQTPAPATFFNAAANLGSGAYYLSFPNGNIFGYYSYLSDPHYIYHFDLGYEYVFDAADGHSGVYLYDFKSQHFFYTSATFPFPYLYDFSLNTTLYYYPDPNNPGRYNTNGVRYFYDYATGKIITE